MSLKIDILSDIHLDNWKNSLRGLTNDSLESFIEIYIKPKSDSLIIAGDLANNASSCLYLLSMLKQYYSNVICCLGNHDFYRTNQTEKALFPKYEDKYNLLTKEIPKLGVTLLDGNVFEIDGVKFGGGCGWYDFTYTKNRWTYLTDYIIYKNFVDMMTDSWAIYDIERPAVLDVPKLKEVLDKMFKQEYDKLEKIHKKCDVMVSHVSPINEPEGIAQRYRNDMLTGCFCFDGMELIKNTTAKKWIFGHTHSKMEFPYNNINFICNPLGYPHEGNGAAIQIEL